METITIGEVARRSGLRQSALSVLSHGSFRDDADLAKELYRLCAPSYEDPGALLQRELEHCDTLYLLREPDGELIAFFMVAYESTWLADRQTPTVYMGLSATRQDTKNSGLVRKLYAAFCADAAQWERDCSTRLLLWFTTATPSAVLSARKLFVECEPDANGSYSAEGARIALGLRQRYYPNADGSEHPFVLCRAAPATLYSAEEVSRIEQIKVAKAFTLLEQLGVQERRGDRLLCIGRVPASNRRSSGLILGPAQLDRLIATI